MRIHNTPKILRIIGMIFFLAGLLVLGLLIANIVSGKAYTSSDVWIGLGIGLGFSFCGWIVFADDYIVFDDESKEIVVYQRAFRTREIARTRLTETSRLRVEPDPDHHPCYRLVLEGHLVRERMSKRQAEQLKIKLARELGLA